MKSGLVRGLPLKILSACLAVILFVLVREDRVKEYDIEVPVTIGGVPDDRIVTEGPPQSARVRLRGRWSDILNAVEKRPTPYTIDMRDHSDGDLVVIDSEVILRDLGVHGLVVLNVTPSSVRVRMETKVALTVSVRPNLLKQPARGYRLVTEGVRVLPAEVKLIGTEAALQGIKEVPTRPIDLSGLDKNLRTDVRLALPPLAPFLKAEPNEVTVEIPIVAELTSEYMANVEIQVRNCHASMICRLEPPRVGVRIVGPLLAVEQIRLMGITPSLYVDASVESTAAGTYPERRVLVQATEGISVLPSPDTSTLSVAGRPISPDASDMGPAQPAAETGDP